MIGFKSSSPLANTCISTTEYATDIQKPLAGSIIGRISPFFMPVVFLSEIGQVQLKNEC